jgi:hypothetical protein
MPRWLLSLLLVMVLVPLAFANPQRSVSGAYESNWDDVRLVHDGDRITGTYVCCGGGTIQGRLIEGRIIRYRWRQPGGEGRGVWHIEGNRLDGTWGIDEHESDGGRWDLVRANSIAN